MSIVTLRCTHGEIPPHGAFLIGKRNRYLVVDVRGRSLSCLRVVEEEIPEDALRISWTWDRR